MRGGFCSCGDGETFASLSERDLQAVWSTLAGFAEKKVGWHDEVVTEEYTFHRIAVFRISFPGKAGAPRACKFYHEGEVL